MNFSGTRYTREQLALIWEDKNLEAMRSRWMTASEVRHRGLRGHRPDARRPHRSGVQLPHPGERIEHALLSWLLERYPARPSVPAGARPSATRTAGKVFADLGFREVGESMASRNWSLQRGDPAIRFITIQTGHCHERVHQFLRQRIRPLFARPWIHQRLCRRQLVLDLTSPLASFTFDDFPRSALHPWRASAQGI